ncbi:MAG: hypothetical protein OXE99_05315 [Cellvibrionales bacterium]|nr:hypothetical protein [Cellvibrionales bacterium]
MKGTVTYNGKPLTVELPTGKYNLKLKGANCSLIYASTQIEAITSANKVTRIKREFKKGEYIAKP